MQKTNKRWIVFCEICSYKQIVEGEEFKVDLHQIKTTIKDQIKLKCPKCGRGITVRNLPGAYSSTIKEIEEKQKKEHAERERKKRIEDGTPVQRETEFLG
jgi:hypothetical protein